LQIAKSENCREFTKEQMKNIAEVIDIIIKYGKPEVSVLSKLQCGLSTIANQIKENQNTKELLQSKILKQQIENTT